MIYKLQIVWYDPAQNFLHMKFVENFQEHNKLRNNQDHF